MDSYLELGHFFTSAYWALPVSRFIPGKAVFLLELWSFPILLSLLLMEMASAPFSFGIKQVKIKQ